MQVKLDDIQNNYNKKLNKDKNNLNNNVNKNNKSINNNKNYYSNNNDDNNYNSNDENNYNINNNNKNQNKIYNKNYVGKFEKNNPNKNRERELQKESDLNSDDYNNDGEGEGDGEERERGNYNSYNYNNNLENKKNKNNFNKNRDDSNNLMINRAGGANITNKKKYKSVKINKFSLTYFCFLVTNYMKKASYLMCVYEIANFQRTYEKNLSLKLLFMTLKKRIIFYKIKFFHRFKKINKYLIKYKKNNNVNNSTYIQNKPKYNRKGYRK
jgi:hypothetical protein